MNDKDINLLLEFSKVKKELKGTPYENSFFNFVKKLNCQPNVVHKHRTIFWRK